MFSCLLISTTHTHNLHSIDLIFCVLIFSSAAVFQPDPSGRLNVTVPRAIYCLIHAAGLAFAVYRIHLMGLLPTNLSDWVAMVQAPPPVARAVTGLLRGPWA